MDGTWKVSVWGTRGSTPMTGKDFLEYGGNTSCISVDCKHRLVVFDAGSGLASLGKVLEKRDWKNRKKRVDILISHLHLDHVQGLFAFDLMHDKKAEIHLYGAREAEFEKSLRTLVGRPYWPLGLADFAADIRIHEIHAGESFCLADEETSQEREMSGMPRLRIHTILGSHPGGSLLYRLESGDKSIVYLLDCEQDEHMLRKLPEFGREGNLVIWDAGFSPEDLAKHAGWGHSSWRQGVELQRRARADRILMTHYFQNYTDSFLREQERLARLSAPACLFAREGMELWIGSRKQ